MPDRYTEPAKGSSDWDVPLNNNFQQLDIDVEHRGTTDPDTAGISPENGAKFLDTSTGEIYTADGTSWTLQWDLGAIGSGGSGGSVDPSTVEGIADTRDHVGPLREGTHHDTDGAGVAFWAQAGLTFNSCVVDTDLSAVTTTTLTIELANYEGGAANPTTVGTADVTVSGGPERIDLTGLPSIPADGEYVLARRTSPNGEVIPCRRVNETNFGAGEYTEHTYDTIDFLRGTSITTSGDAASEGYYYYWFDIQIGDPYTQVTSPWSTDVDEIYMRPRDPAEEFDVSPRAIWFDNS